MHTQSDVPIGLRSSTAVTTPTVPVADAESVLAALSDEAAHSMLCVADEPRTAKELADECDIPLSTVYRKLDRLVTTALIEETTRARVRGKHPQQYRRRFETLRVHVSPRRSSGLAVSMIPRPVEEY